MLLENDSFPDDTRVKLEARSLCRAGYQVAVICPTDASRRWYEYVDGVRVYRYPRPFESRGILGYLCEYAYSLSVTFVLTLYVLLRHGFDVLHPRLPPDTYVVLAAFYKLLGKKYVADLQDLSPELYQAQCGGEGNPLILAALKWFERQACRWADCLITTNQTQRRLLIERTGVLPDRCYVVRNAPDEIFLKPNPLLESFRKDGRTIIGYMGLMGVQDHVEVLLHAARCLKIEHRRNDFRVVFVGAGPALQDVKQLAAQLDLQSCVEFAGYRIGEELRRYMASFDICVTPDPSNPYNDTCTTIKTMEYMALAKPIVAFDLPENRVTAGDAALYAARNDVRELARLIRHLMDNPEERTRLGRLGHQRVVEHWRWEIQQNNLLALYEALLSSAAISTAGGGRSLDAVTAKVSTVR
jgi:glycosyltransferase involved in cell wall biosynthesis